MRKVKLEMNDDGTWSVFINWNIEIRAWSITEIASVSNLTHEELEKIMETYDKLTVTPLPKR